jgi:hypothetical protein
MADQTHHLIIIKNWKLTFSELLLANCGPHPEFPFLYTQHLYTGKEACIEILEPLSDPERYDSKSHN